MNGRSTARTAVRLLTAQAVAFGVTMALLIIPANALFLDTYGAQWLPATYIAIAITGVGVSWIVAGAVRRFPLVNVAAVTLSVQTLILLGSWIVLRSGGRWVTAPLLVLFALAIQIGFVFVGGQAGRLLDVRELKELFPRIVSGFVVGFFLGGLAGAPLLALLGGTEQLLLATATAQLAFLLLLLLTERRCPAVTEPAATDDEEPPRRMPLRAMAANRLVLVIVAYQVLSAVGSQLVEFVFFDRAAARYADPDDLTRFLSWYTAALNLAEVLLLASIAGPLLKRYGLRFGLLANPAVVAGAMAVMAVVAAGPGPVGLGFLALAGATRFADILLTDGTTRTSINATYQVLPVEDRLAVQATVEGAGVPLAIGFTGALLLVLQVLPGDVTVVIVIGVVVCAVWTAVAWFAHRAYDDGLRRVVVQRRLSDTPVDLGDERDADALARLLASDDGRQVELGLDLLAGLASPVGEAELRRLLDDDQPEVRLAALAELAGANGASVLGAIDPATLMNTLDGDGELDDPRTLRALRACRSLPGDVAVDLLLRHVDHRDRAVGLAVLRAIAGSAPEPSTRLDAALRELVAADALHARTILTARLALALPSSSALDRALDDEFVLLRDRALAVLTIHLGDVAARAERNLHSADGSTRALALEALDVAVARDDRPALTLVRADLDDRARLEALGGPVDDRTPPAWLADMTSDPQGVWRSPWLSACAEHHLLEAGAPSS